LTRRAVLSGGGSLALGLALAGCGEAPTRSAPAGVRGAVFNTGSADVTLFDPASNRVTGSSRIGAVVRWLSNEQRFWDGRRIWTYDFPGNEVRAIAIDPDTFQVVAEVPVGGEAPGHSLVLTPDRRRGFVNAANSDLVAVVDPVAGRVIGQVPTGAYP
jgi:DNA-binding beta-propeller fold protein YncE